MDMIERIAKAIYEGRNGVGAVAWAHRQDGYKDPYRIDARSAIKAMREPTPEMLEVGPPEPYMDGDVWSKMIDAALSRPTPEHRSRATKPQPKPPQTPNGKPQ